MFKEAREHVKGHALKVLPRASPTQGPCVVAILEGGVWIRLITASPMADSVVSWLVPLQLRESEGGQSSIVQSFWGFFCISSLWGGRASDLSPLGCQPVAQHHLILEGLALVSGRGGSTVIIGATLTPRGLARGQLIAWEQPPRPSPWPQCQTSGFSSHWTSIWKRLNYGLNCVFPHPNSYVKAYPSVSQNVTVFGVRTFKEVIKWQWGCWLTPDPVWLVSSCRGHLDTQTVWVCVRRGSTVGRCSKKVAICRPRREAC